MRRMESGSASEHRTRAFGRSEVPEPDERDQNRNHTRSNTPLHLRRPGVKLGNVLSTHLSRHAPHKHSQY